MPSRRNSGFDTTWTSSRRTARSTTRVEPTGTVDLLTMIEPGRKRRADLGGRRLDVAEIGRAVVALRRRHAQEHDVGAGRRGGGAEHELEPAGGPGGRDDLGQPLLDDGDLTPVEQVDLVGVDVGADHVVTELRQTGTRRETDVAGPDDRD